MANGWQSATHGTAGFVFAYLLVLGVMAAAFLRNRAGSRNLLRLPLLAIPVLVAGVVVVALASPLLSVLGRVLQPVCGAGITAATAWFAAVWLAQRSSLSDAVHLRGAVVSRERLLGWHRGRSHSGRDCTVGIG